jgi:hypothetical protein
MITTGTPITARITTRTFGNITLTKGSDFDAREAGAAKVWFTNDGRFEVRADANCERPSELEWGVWDTKIGDWADGGRGNGVCPNTLAACCEVIASVLADEAKEALKAKCPALVAQIEAQGLDKADEDPNAERTAYLKAELKEAISQLTKSFVAREKANQQADRDLARMEKIKKELDGLAALKAREDAWHAANS